MGVGDHVQIQGGIYYDSLGAASQAYTQQCDGFWTIDGDWRHGDMIVSHLNQSAYMLGTTLIGGAQKVFVSTFDDLTTFEDTIT